MKFWSLLALFSTISTTVFSAQLILNWKPEAEFGGFYEAERAGYYRAEKLDLKIVPGGVGTPAIQMVASGKAEFGISAADEVVLSRANGTDVIGIFTVYQTNPQGMLVQESNGAKSIEDLLAKGTLAYQKGLPSFRYLENKFGQVRAKVVPYIGSISQMSKDRSVAIQCYVTSEPIAARKQGLKVKSFLISETGFNPYSTMVIIRRRYLDKNPKEVAAFLRATTKGWRSYLKNPTATNRIMATLNPSMDFETLQESAKIQRPLIETLDTKKGGLGVMTEARWKVLTDQLQALGLVAQVQAPAEYFQWSSKH